MTFAFVAGFSVCSCGLDEAVPPAASPPRPIATPPPMETTWAVAEAMCSGPAWRTVFLAGGPQLPSVGFNPQAVSQAARCNAACSGGDEKTCGVLVVNELNAWRGNPGFVAQEPDPRLEELATRTTKACSAGYQPACIAGRRIAIETTLRQADRLLASPEAKALGNQLRQIRIAVMQARSWVGPQLDEVDKAEAAANEALKAAKTAIGKVGVEN